MVDVTFSFGFDVRVWYTVYIHPLLSTSSSTDYTLQLYKYILITRLHQLLRVDSIFVRDNIITTRTDFLTRVRVSVCLRGADVAGGDLRSPADGPLDTVVSLCGSGGGLWKVTRVQDINQGRWENMGCSCSTLTAAPAAPVCAVVDNWPHQRHLEH